MTFKNLYVKAICHMQQTRLANIPFMVKLSYTLSPLILTIALYPNLTGEETDAWVK